MEGKILEKNQFQIQLLLVLYPVNQDRPLERQILQGINEEN